MRAMMLERVGEPLREHNVPIPTPQPEQVLLKVQVCGICRTDLHIVDGELIPPQLPLILGHQIVGTVIETGSQSSKFSIGTRVGVPWLGQTCRSCRYCQSGQENLCDRALFTGYDRNGGYAEYTVANEQFCFALPESIPDLQVAPLLCAGLIGYRSYRMTKEAQKIGFYGFGAAAHILPKMDNFLICSLICHPEKTLISDDGMNQDSCVV